MNIENIERAKTLMSQRDTLRDLLDYASKWKSGHFEFVEHYGRDADRIVLMGMLPEFKNTMLDLIEKEIGNIEQELCKL